MAHDPGLPASPGVGYTLATGSDDHVMRHPDTLRRLHQRPGRSAALLRQRRAKAVLGNEDSVADCFAVFQR
jgi:hypothetical protein